MTIVTSFCFLQTVMAHLLVFWSFIVTIRIVTTASFLNTSGRSHLNFKFLVSGYSKNQFLNSEESRLAFLLTIISPHAARWRT